MEKAAEIRLPAGEDLLASVLKDVSRSFYRTLAILPGAVRRQISLAYLLARTSDTIADSSRVPMGDRLTALEAFGARATGVSNQPLALPKLCDAQTPASEQVLLRRVEESLSLLQTFDRTDRELIAKVLDTIISGQRRDLVRFEQGAQPGSIASLATPEELDAYTYMVAGCVGEFWTRMCRRHLFPAASLDEDALIEDGIRFGKGLQLVNILRDLPSDLRQGRCYMPASQLAGLGLKPEDLLTPTNYPRFKPLHERWMNVAEQHLRAGWAYTNRLPRNQVRVRLACAWPLLIGFETLRVLRQGNVLDSSKRLKVPRRWVKRMLVRSVVSYPFPWLWRGLVAGHR